MFKRIFWVGVGVAIGIVAVTKAQAYVKANTPDAARQFLLGPDENTRRVGQRVQCHPSSPRG